MKPEGDTYFNSSYTGPTLWTPEEHYQKLTFEKIGKGSADHAKQSKDGWIAISQHFFVSAFIPPANTQRDIYTKSLGNNLFAIGAVEPLGTVAPGATVSNAARLYSGPQVQSLLEGVTPGLDLVRDYAWAAIIAKPIFATMNWLHSMIGNWGWTIIAFTILIKLLFFPLSAAGYRSMAKMKTVTPKMQAIRERFKTIRSRCSKPRWSCTRPRRSTRWAAACRSSCRCRCSWPCTGCCRPRSRCAAHRGWAGSTT